jgi:hypothetical protein
VLAESSYLACLTDYSISFPPNQPRETYARLLAAEIGARVPGNLLEEQGADIKILKKDTAVLKQNARSMLSMLEGICEKLQVIPHSSVIPQSVLLRRKKRTRNSIMMRTETSVR